MGGAYLTIDDSPTPDTLTLCDFMSAHDVPAIFYCRGDHIAQYPEVAVEMVKRGFVLGNHGYAHKRATSLSTQEVQDDILKCEALIDAAYQSAEIKRTGKYFRFPYLDRGCGAWIVDYDALPAEHSSIIQKLFAEGLYLDDTQPSPALLQKQKDLQLWLTNQGFSVPFENVKFPWYTHPEMSAAHDALYTFSTADWMMTARHLTKNHPYKTIDDLKQKIDDDPFLHDATSNNIVLIHDQKELTSVFKALLSHMIARGIKFLPIAGSKGLLGDDERTMT
jgi:peptidoglycan/xylan/chitin deacetylase (PgdA/CDA1 family)